MVCIRCQKRPAIIFVQRMENGQMKNEGYCLHCARELHIKPVEDLMKQFGMSDEDMDNMEDRMENMMQELGDGSGSMNPFSMMMNMGQPREDDDGDEDLMPGSSATFPLSMNGGTQEAPKGDKKPGRNGKKPPRRKFLDTYCENLTRKAKEGKLDDIIGRDREIYRTIQILSRRQKNNPCLIGEAGVGKTAIAEGIAERIAKGDVPAGLKEKEIYLLDLTSLVAGTQFRGQFESRMKGLIEEIRKMGNVILVIDEVHNIVGAGDAEGSMNAANILKPALSRGEIQVIGATTFTEYRKHIEKDTALERRFQPVTVNEPNMEDTLKILKGIAHYYEQYHGVKIPEGILRQAVLLSERYITDRFLPDKAIDLIDEACSDLNLHDKNINRRMELRREIEDYDKERELLQGAEEPDFERLAELKSLTMKAQEELDALCAQGDPQLSMDNLARVIELWTKIPASRIREDEFHRLSELDKRLKEHIVGQDEAIEAVSGGDGEPMTAPAFRISMGSAESAKSCFLVFYDTNQTPYAAICCEVDPDNGGQSGGFEAAFTNPDLTEGATLERITEENMNRIAGEFAEKDGTAESWTSTFAEALGMGQTIYALTYTSAAPKNTELTVSAYSNVMCMPWGIAWLSAEPTGDTGIDITMSRPGAEDPATGMVNFMDASGETACIIYCNPAF